jgi:hypothetical protein
VTWTLRFYDEDGVEIGYAEKPDRDTYNYAVTHPEPGWEDFEAQLAAKSRLTPPSDEHIDLNEFSAPDWKMVSSGPMAATYEPEKHLRLAREAFGHPDVERITLRNE